MPSSARTRIDASADTEALRFGRFDEDKVLGRVEIDGQRATDLGVGGTGSLCGGSMGEPAPRSEREVDDLGRSEAECVRAGAVAVGDEHDVRGSGYVRERFEERGHRLRGDEREVDREDEDGLRATGDDVGPCLGEARIETVGPLAERPGADLGCAGQDLGVGADDEDVVEPIDGQGGPDGPCQEALDEVMPLLGVERPPSRVLAPSRVPTGMIAAILIGRARAPTPRELQDVARSRARPAWSPMTVSMTRVRKPRSAISDSSAASSVSSTKAVATPR